jgi:hypothetical protein
MAIWVFIKPFVLPDGDTAKNALPKHLKEKDKTLKEAIEQSLLDRILKSLPKDKYSNKEADKPAGVSKSFNAIRITGDITLKVETKGSTMKVTCSLKVVIEAIKTPDIQNGELLISGSSGAFSENRGSDERAIAAGANDVLDSIVEPLITKLITHNNFIATGKRLGLPLEAAPKKKE